MVAVQSADATVVHLPEVRWVAAPPQQGAQRLYAAMSRSAPPGMIRTSVAAGEYVSEVDCEGVVEQAGVEQLRIAGTALRFALPPELDLRSLQGAHIRVELRHVVHLDGAATVDCRLFHRGELVFWLRDGRPGDDTPKELPVEVADGALFLRGRRIEVSRKTRLRLEGRVFRLLGLRAGVSDVALVATRHLSR